jgi:hypothetical protein
MHIGLRRTMSWNLELDRFVGLGIIPVAVSRSVGRTG